MKHAHYTGDLTRGELMQALTVKHEAMLATLDQLEGDGEFAHVIVQHEALHQGQWSLYASLAGFETPPSWRLNWGI